MVTGVATMQKVDADRRRRRLGTKVEDVRQLEAQHLLGEGQGGVEIRRGQHGVTQAHVAGDKVRYALRRDKWLTVGAMAPAQFVAVARRVLEADQRLHTALLDLLGAAVLPLDAEAVQVIQGSLKRSLRGQFPARGQVARLAAFDDQHAKRTLVHLHVQPAGRRRHHLHAQYILGVALPLAEVLAHGDEIAQSTNLDHAVAPEWQIRYLRPLCEARVSPSSSVETTPRLRCRVLAD
ncbi:hypothetical protein D3C77_239670 [compost metagenome]